MVSFRKTPLLALVPGHSRIASVRGGFEWDAGELERDTLALATRLEALGLARGDRVVVCAPDPVRYLLAMFACWTTGLCCVAVNPQLSAQELRNVVETSEAAAIAAEEIQPVDAKRKQAERVLAGQPLSIDDPAVILMTSGTTGRPKGIVHSLRSLICRIHLNIAEIGPATMTETLCVLPVFFGHGLIGNCLTPLVAGARLRIWPQPDIREIAGLGALIAESGTTFMSSVPSFWKIALRLASAPASPLKRIHVGSAPLSPGFGGTSQIGAARMAFSTCSA